MKLYTSKTCAVCNTLKQYLAKYNKDYDTIDVTDNVEARRELQDKYQAVSVPVLVADNGDFMVGFNPAKFMSMIK